MAATTGTHRRWHQPAGLMSRAMGWPMMMGARQVAHVPLRRALRTRVASARRSGAVTAGFPRLWCAG